MSIVVDKEVIVKDKDLKWWLDRITELEEDNKKLENKIMRLKITKGIISDCIMFAFLCVICAWCLCMLFMMITDVIMWFQFVRYA